MGHDVAQKLGLALFGRATHRHFICYCGFDRFISQPEPRRVVAPRGDTAPADSVDRP
jgi:FdhD protein